MNHLLDFAIFTCKNNSLYKISKLFLEICIIYENLKLICQQPRFYLFHDEARQWFCCNQIL